MAERIAYTNGTMQDELVASYCAEADTFLSTAADYVTALQMKDWLCRRFEEKCSSPLLIHATREFIERRIQERWKQNGDLTDNQR